MDGSVTSAEPTNVTLLPVVRPCCRSVVMAAEYGGSPRVSGSVSMSTSEMCNSKAKFSFPLPDTERMLFRGAAPATLVTMILMLMVVRSSWVRVCAALATVKLNPVTEGSVKTSNRRKHQVMSDSTINILMINKVLPGIWLGREAKSPSTTVLWRRNFAPPKEHSTTTFNKCSIICTSAVGHFRNISAIENKLVHCSRNWRFQVLAWAMWHYIGLLRHVDIVSLF